MCAVVAVDIDDTLYSFTDAAREILSLMVDELPQYPWLSHALYAKWDQWRTPFELCGEDEDGESLWLQCIDRVHDDESISEQQPFLGAAQTCHELLYAGHDLIYISNRKTETKEATENWLVDHGFFDQTRGQFPHDHIGVPSLVVCAGDKAPYIRDAQYMIDDRPKNVIEFIHDYQWTSRPVAPPAPRRKAFVRVTDYNGGLTDIPGLYLAHTWAGLRRYLVKEGLLRAEVLA